MSMNGKISSGDSSGDGSGIYGGSGEVASDGC